jgi:hypothetical protein
MAKVSIFSKIPVCKACCHADAFCYFYLREVDAPEIPCVCYYITMSFVYLDLLDIWSPLLSPLRIHVKY